MCGCKSELTPEELQEVQSQKLAFQLNIAACCLNDSLREKGLPNLGITVEVSGNTSPFKSSQCLAMALSLGAEPLPFLILHIAD